MKKYIVFVNSIAIVLVGIVLSFSIHIGTEKEKQVRVQIAYVDYEKDKIWRNNSRGQMSENFLFDADNVLIYNDGYCLYNYITNKKDLLCKKEGCLHNGKQCVNNIRYTNPIAENGVIFAIDDTRYNLLRIENSEVYTVYVSDSLINELWMDRDQVYFSTEYELLCFDRATKKVEKVLDRPVLFAYLFFYEDRLVFVDENYFLNMSDRDGQNQRIICKDLVNMPELSTDRIYYRKNDMHLYSNSYEGNDEKNVLDRPVYRYMVTAKGIYYTLEEGQGFNMYYKSFCGEEEKVFKNAVSIDFLIDDKYLIIDKDFKYYLYESETGTMTPFDLYYH